MIKKMNKKAIAIIVAVIAVIAVVGGSFAWFATHSSLTQKFSITGFRAGADVYFESKDGTKTPASGYETKEGLYTLSLNDTDINYIGNLRVTATIKGASARMRIRINHEWNNADGSVAQYTTAVPYEFGKNWYDNRSTDYYVYYQGQNLSGKTDFDSCDFITGFDESNFDSSGFTQGTTLKLSIKVDAVQINRYPQLWDIEKLPWN